MKAGRFCLLMGTTIWAVLTLKVTPPSYAAQDTYTYTVVVEFPPLSSGFREPSFLAEGPVITNDGTVVYSVDTPTPGTGTIYSSDGTISNPISGPFDHQFTPLILSVSGNGMLLTNNFNRAIIDVHDGAVVGFFDPGDEFRVRMGPELYYDVALNNRGSVAFTGGTVGLCQFAGHELVDGGVFRFDGETTTTIALLGVPIDSGAISFLAWPSVNDRGQVAFLSAVSDFCPSTPGLKSGTLYLGDGKKLVKIAEANSAPSVNNRGDVAFIGVNNGASSVIVSDGKKTRIVADTNGPFAFFLSFGTRFPGSIGNFESGVSLNDGGNIAFMAALDNGGLGIFTGPDVVKHKIIAVGDSLAGSSVTELVLSRQSLNNAGQVAFQATLADGRKVIVRAELKALVN